MDAPDVFRHVEPRMILYSGGSIFENLHFFQYGYAWPCRGETCLPTCPSGQYADSPHDFTIQLRGEIITRIVRGVNHENEAIQIQRQAEGH